MWCRFHSSQSPDVVPSARECMSMCAVDRTLYLFGGNNRVKRINAIHKLNTATMMWSKVDNEARHQQDSTHIPVARSAHTCAVVGGKNLYIFGGWDGSRELGDLNVFDTASEVWRVLDSSGPKPTPRHFHSTCEIGGNLYVFAGFDGLAWRNDVWELDTTTNVWSEVHTNGPCPGPRASGGSCAISHNAMLVFGGYNGSEFLDDLWLFKVSLRDGQRQYEWIRLDTDEGAGATREQHWPLARSGHTVDVHGSLAFVFGGRHRAGRFNDVQVFDLRSMRWWAPTIAGVSPLPRKTHATARVHDKLYVFGGHDGDSWLNDFYILDLSTIVQSVSPKLSIQIPPSTRVQDMMSMLPCNVREYLGNSFLSFDDDGSASLIRLSSTESPPNLSRNSMQRLADSFTNEMSTSSVQLSVDTHSSQPLSMSAGPQGGGGWSSRHSSYVTDNTLTPIRSSMGMSNVSFSTCAPTSSSCAIPPDIVVRVAEEDVLLHASVLSSRCSFFRAMFASGMRETCCTRCRTSAIENRAKTSSISTTEERASRPPEAAMHLDEIQEKSDSTATDEHSLPTVKLEDVSLRVFAAFVCYLYTDTLPAGMPDSLVLPMLQLSQRLGVVRLSLLCQRILEARISIGNAASILESADLHCAHPLREACMTFIMRNFEEVSRSACFLSLDNELLREVMYRRAYPQLSPTSVKKYLENVRSPVMSSPGVTSPQTTETRNVVTKDQTNSEAAGSSPINMSLVTESDAASERQYRKRNRSRSPESDDFQQHPRPMCPIVTPSKRCRFTSQPSDSEASE